MKTKILFICTDMMPYTTEGIMAQIGRYLPQGMAERGHEVRIFMPRFGIINERRNQLHEVIRLSGMNLIVNETDHPLVLKVASIQSTRLQVYFIDNDDYFTGRGQYGPLAGEKGRAEVTLHREYADNAERCVFFARGVIETVRKLRWKPDVVFCQGWFTAIVPIYMKRAFGDDPCFRGVKIAFALYDNAFRSMMPATFSRVIHRDGITKSDLSEVRDKEISCTDLCRLALKYSDALIVNAEEPSQWLLDFAERSGYPILHELNSMEDPAERPAVLDRYHTFFESLVCAPEAAGAS